MVESCLGPFSKIMVQQCYHLLMVIAMVHIDAFHIASNKILKQLFVNNK